MQFWQGSVITASPTDMRFQTRDVQLIRELLFENEASRMEPSGDIIGDPGAFVLECFDWRGDEGPTPYQLDVLRKLRTERRVALRGPHGLGKTALASWVVLWFALTRNMMPGADWKVVTTASAWRQLTHYLWPEIHKWTRRLRWDMLGRGPLNERTELLHRILKLTNGEAFAVASDKSALIEGAHASHLLYVFDEARGIPPATWDAAEGALASGNCYALAISTPGEPQGRFYDIHARKPGYEDWTVQHVKLAECIAAGRVSPAWAEQRRKQWGEKSAVYQNRVLGEFASSEEDGIIPLAWVEAANGRWRALNDSGEWGPLTRLGCDIADGGVDLNSIARRHGMAIRILERPNERDTMGMAGRIAGIQEHHEVEAVVDAIGIGAGVTARLRELGLSVVAFSASERTDMRDLSGEMRFRNKRAAAWWHMRELLDPANEQNVALPPDDTLTGDLTAPHWRDTSAGVQIESKDDIKKRLGRSTDDGDAVVMAFWQEPVRVGPRIRSLA